MKVYNITIIYDKTEKTWKYNCEDISKEISREEYMDMAEDEDFINLADYFDEEGLELIKGCYIMGEA